MADEKYWKEKSRSKVQQYQDLVQEAVHNKVVPQALRAAADAAIKELIEEKIRLLVSNKNLTAAALEIEDERLELEHMLHMALEDNDWYEDDIEIPREAVVESLRKRAKDLKKHP